MYQFLEKIWQIGREMALQIMQKLEKLEKSWCFSTNLLTVKNFILHKEQKLY